MKKVQRNILTPESVKVLQAILIQTAIDGEFSTQFLEDNVFKDYFY